MSRLIDADALKMYMRNALEETRNCYPDGGEWAATITEEFCKDIDEQPTIEERKTGKWIRQEGDIYRCSECETDTHAAECMGDPIYNFCPWCGARMPMPEPYKGEDDETV